eukprot:TRINITY_DN9219_c0_g1_i2.p1 TRINITY_DN9219_c0_g1~~TRINITY_DN9219_c0_g1_i2.p1  ORF type:complete len:923 (-),score=205.17 TRINITY_DN9219_c0_g1_i2:256-3024(-)
MTPAAAVARATAAGVPARGAVPWRQDALAVPLLVLVSLARLSSSASSTERKIPSPPPPLSLPTAGVPLAALERACGLRAGGFEAGPDRHWVWSAGGAAALDDEFSAGLGGSRRSLQSRGAGAAEARTALAGASAATLGGRRFWRSSRGLRVQSIKARASAALKSPVVFEIPLGAAVGQAARCELVDDILRIPVFEPAKAGVAEASAAAAVPTGAPRRVGWVTLSAEQKGGPRFFEEVPSSQVEGFAAAAGLRLCSAAAADTQTASGEAAKPLDFAVAGGSSGVLSENSDPAGRAFPERSRAAAARGCAEAAAAAGNEPPLCSAEGPGGSAAATDLRGSVLALDAGMFRELAAAAASVPRDALWVVVTFTPWSLPSRRALEAWRLLARSGAAVSSRLRFAAVNCHAEAELCDGELGLLGHPLVTVLHSGEGGSPGEAARLWQRELGENASGRSTWLPANWTSAAAFLAAIAADGAVADGNVGGDGSAESALTARVRRWLEALPEDLRPRFGDRDLHASAAAAALAARPATASHPPPSPTSLSDSCARRAAAAAARATAAAPAGGASGAPSVGAARGPGLGSSEGSDASRERVAALAAFAASLEVRAITGDRAEGEALGLRQLSALETWLRAALPRLSLRSAQAPPPRLEEEAEEKPLRAALEQLQAFASQALDDALALGGDSAVCLSAWERALAPVRAEAARLLHAHGFSGDAGRPSAASAWTLLHGLACASNATVVSAAATGPDLLEALWAVLSAELPFAQVLGGTSLPGERGGDQVLVAALEKGKFGVAEAAAEAEVAGAADVSMVLWRLHAAVTALQALTCAGRGASLDLRWPSAASCPACWSRCFRQRRFCWEPWEEQRAVFAAAANAEAAALAAAAGGADAVLGPKIAYTDGAGGTVSDALPNEEAVQKFLSLRCARR